MATPVLLNSGEATNTSGTTIAVTISGGSPPEGSYVIASCSTNDGSFTNPSGYATLVQELNTVESDLTRTVGKFAGASESATLTFTDFAGNTKHARVQSLSNIDAADPINQTVNLGRQGPGTSATLTCSAANGIADAFAYAVIAIRADVSAESATNSFVSAGNGNGTFSDTRWYRIYSADATPSTVITWTTGGFSWGTMVVLNGTSGGGPITLSADPATYAVSAAPATLARAHNFNAESAAYTYTAAAAQLIAGRAVITSAAAYTIVASAADLLRTYVLVASPAAYDVSAQAATLSTDRNINAQPAAYTLTAFDADLATAVGGITLDAQPAAYAVAAFDTTLTATRAINAAAVSYAVAADAQLSRGGAVGADAAAYAVVAADAVLAASKAVNAQPAAYVVVADATLARGGIFSADPSAYTLSAIDADLATGTAALVLDAQPAVYGVAAFDAELVNTGGVGAGGDSNFIIMSRRRRNR